ncbi:Amidase-like protein 1 [Elsinoe fawcettii]|nr:Amidase-like protein 1 [Elsinoe fawcettii]
MSCVDQHRAYLPVQDVLHFQIGQQRFIVRFQDAVTLSEQSDQTETYIFTAIRAPITGNIDRACVQRSVNALKALDVLFGDHFLENIIFTGPGATECCFKKELQNLLTKWHTTSTTWQPSWNIEDGPYVVISGMAYKMWKVCEDPALAFVQAVWPSLESPSLTLSTDSRSCFRSFEQVPASGHDFRAPSLAIPLRYGGHESLTSHVQSLYGLRVAIKDNFAVAGCCTSLCNRAYWSTQPIQKTNAALVTRLIEAGAKIVGKTHMSGLTMLEHPTQSGDYQAPFNPRGDGRLIPSGSSSGSACAVSSYEWIDLAIGSDTTGSIRIPAFQTGVFGFRPSISSLPTDGMKILWPAFDVPSWLGRDLSMFPQIYRCLSNQENAPCPVAAKQWRVIYLDDTLVKMSEQQTDLTEEFLNDLDRVTSVKHQRVNILQDWYDNSPVMETDLMQWFQNLQQHGWTYEAYHSYDEFRETYKDQHGRRPFVTEMIQKYWNIGMEVKHSEYDEVMSRIDVFREWFINRYLSDPQYNTAIVLQIKAAQPRYRDVYPAPTGDSLAGLEPVYLAPMLGAPELAVPIGEISYDSQVTDCKEWLPTVISIMGKPNEDEQLLGWVLESLEKVKRPTKVQTGSRVFATHKDSRVEVENITQWQEACMVQ